MGEMSVTGHALMALLLISGLLHSVSAASTYTVGGNSGWTFQAANNAFYDDQFAALKLVVGDSLLFIFESPLHNVFEVTQADLATCTTSKPLTTYTATNSTVTLTSAGYHGFICGVPGHCSAGMHLSVQVLATSSPTPAPSTPPPTAAPSTPPPTAAPSTPPSSPPPTPAPTTAPPTSAPTTGPPTPTPTPVPSVAPAPGPSVLSPAPSPVPAPTKSPVPAPAPQAHTPTPTVATSPLAPEVSPSAPTPGESSGSAAVRPCCGLILTVGALVAGCATLLL